MDPIDLSFADCIAISGNVAQCGGSELDDKESIPFTAPVDQIAPKSLWRSAVPLFVNESVDSESGSRDLTRIKKNSSDFSECLNIQFWLLSTTDALLKTHVA
jgi:hypothetical protein